VVGVDLVGVDLAVVDLAGAGLVGAAALGAAFGAAFAVVCLDVGAWAATTSPAVSATAAA